MQRSAGFAPKRRLVKVAALVGRGDAFAQPLPVVAMAIELAVLELDPRPLRTLGDEANLDLVRLRVLRAR